MPPSLPPDAVPSGPQRGSGAAASICLPPRIETLRKRPDFLRAASAGRQGMPGFLLQARPRRDEEGLPGDLVRIGFTCSKKLGNAVKRNRAKRRLRALAQGVLPGHARPGWDYVLVGRPEATASRDFAQLQSDLMHALSRVHSASERRRR